jgi:hypothetical protein
MNNALNTIVVIPTVSGIHHHLRHFSIPASNSFVAPDAVYDRDGSDAALSGSGALAG